MTRPCKSGLALRPKRLFGLLLEPTDGAPCSEAGSITQGLYGLPSIGSFSGPEPVGNREIQGLAASANSSAWSEEIG